MLLHPPTLSDRLDWTKECFEMCKGFTEFQFLSLYLNQYFCGK